MRIIGKFILRNNQTSLLREHSSNTQGSEIGYNKYFLAITNKDGLEKEYYFKLVLAPTEQRQGLYLRRHLAGS